MDNSDNDLSIECRHRKEKKELQAQIQAMKKSAKNDKTKKKELVSEIARLETEMDFRHKHELEHHTESNINKNEPDLVDTIEREPEMKHKVSKAQKRRDKKSLQEKAREEEIKLQDKENILGPRNIESQSIALKLKERHLEVFPIPSDGDCLYKAVAHQLSVLRKQNYLVDKLREIVATYIRQNKDDFFPFMSNPDTCDMLTDDEFEEYCDKIIDTKVWGGQLEIRALSNSLKCPINVIQGSGPDTIEQGTEYEGPPLIITYHRHMYKLGEHYNSTVQKSEEK